LASSASSTAGRLAALASSIASPPQRSTSPLTYTTLFRSDPGASASGLARVELWVKTPGGASYSKAATDATPSASGSFSYTAAAGDGGYSFDPDSADQAVNVQPPQTSADSTTLVDTVTPSS